MHRYHNNSPERVQKTCCEDPQTCGIHQLCPSCEKAAYLESRTDWEALCDDFAFLGEVTGWPNQPVEPPPLPAMEVARLVVTLRDPQYRPLLQLAFSDLIAESVAKAVVTALGQTNGHHLNGVSHDEPSRVQ